MATLATWVAATRRHLMTGRQEERNTLSAPYTPGDTTLSFTGALGGIVPGTRLSIGLHTFYVAATSDSTLTATVYPAQDGSVAVAAPAGTMVWVGPRFTDFEIAEALADELRDLSAPDNGLWALRIEDVPYASGFSHFALTDPDVLDVYAVYAVAADDTYAPFLRMAYRLDRGEAGGPSLTMLSAVPAETASLRVLVRAPFVVPTDPTTDLATTGLPVTAYDIPPLGAAMRLVLPREIKRNFTEAQGDTRRAAEVQAGSVSNSMRSLAALRMQRIIAESGRLSSLYPDRRL